MTFRRAAALACGALIAVALALVPLGMPAAAGVFDIPEDDFYEVFEDNQLSVDVVHGVFSNDLTSRGGCVAATDVTGLKGHLPLDSLGPNGQFQFSPNPDFNGATSFTYTLGLVDGGCTSTGNSATVTITVFEINDPPAIQLNPLCENGIKVAEDSGAFADPGHCVEMVSFGPVDENNQGFEEWVVSSTKPALFAEQPNISPVDGLFGSLSFTPKANANGTSTVTIRGRDGASASDGGNDLSDPVTFKITITAVDDPTEVPATEEPPDEPTPEPTPAQPSPVEPTAPVPTVAATPAPSIGSPPTADASPAPDSTASGGAGPLPIVLAILLVVLVFGFGAALFVPKWRADRGR
jgi:hypothetical protein